MLSAAFLLSLTSGIGCLCCFFWKNNSLHQDLEKLKTDVDKINQRLALQVDEGDFLDRFRVELNSDIDRLDEQYRIFWNKEKDNLSEADRQIFEEMSTIIQSLNSSQEYQRQVKDNFDSVNDRLEAKLDAEELAWHQEQQLSSEAVSKSD